MDSSSLDVLELRRYLNDNNGKLRAAGKGPEGAIRHNLYNEISFLFFFRGVLTIELDG